MPFTVEYGDPGLIGQVALQAGQSLSRRDRERMLEDIRRFNVQQQFREAQLQEQQRQFDLGIEQSIQSNAMRGQLAYDQMGQQAYQFDKRAAQVEQDRLANLYARQQDTQARNLLSQQQMAAEYVRDQQNRKFQRAMADRQTINEFQGWRDENQQREAIGRWEQLYDMDWGTPDILAQQVQTDQLLEQNMQPLRAAATINGEQFLPDEALQGFIVPDQKNPGRWMIDWPNFNRTKDTFLKGREFDRRREQDAYTRQQDVVEQEAKIEQQQIEQEHKLRLKEEQERLDRIQDFEKHKQKMRQDYESARASALIKAIEAGQKAEEASVGYDAEGNPTAPTVKASDYTDKIMAEWERRMKPVYESSLSEPFTETEIARPQSKEEYDALPVGTHYMDPNGAVRIKGE